MTHREIVERLDGGVIGSWSLVDKPVNPDYPSVSWWRFVRYFRLPNHQDREVRYVCGIGHEPYRDDGSYGRHLSLSIQAEAGEFGKCVARVDNETGVTCAHLCWRQMLPGVANPSCVLMSDDSLVIHLFED